MISRNDGSFELQEGFNTQRKVENHFAQLEKNDFNEKIRNGLLSIISNVILFEVPGSQGEQFHFRIAMENTSSFRYLEWGYTAAVKGFVRKLFLQTAGSFLEGRGDEKIASAERRYQYAGLR